MSPLMLKLKERASDIANLFLSSLTQTDIKCTNSVSRLVDYQ